MSERRRVYPPSEVVEPMLGWENTMSHLAGTRQDCTLVLLRLQQALDRFPWLKPWLQPAINETRSIRTGIEETMKSAFHFWNGSFWEPLQRSGFEDPERSKIV